MADKETKPSEENELSSAEIAKLNIHQRINAVRAEVSYVMKDKEVGSGSYAYKVVTHDQVTKIVRESLIKFGINVIPCVIDQTVVMDSGMQTAKGVPIIRYEALYHVDFINVDKPEEKVTSVVSAHALDQGDKAPGKAISYAVKTALLKVFSLQTGEEDEERVAAEGNRLDAVLDCSFAVRKNFQSIAELKQAIAAEDAEQAAMVWFEIGDEDKELLRLAPTKGGILTTDERSYMSVDPFLKTLRVLIKEEAADKQLAKGMDE